MDLQRAERAIARSGTYYDPDSKIAVKIVAHGNDYGVETTVNGDRRLPIEPPMPLAEAQRFALAQLLQPRATNVDYEYVRTRNDSKPSTPISTRPYKSLSNVLADYKRQGLDQQSAWSRYITDTILLPRFKTETVDSTKKFFKLYNKW